MRRPCACCTSVPGIRYLSNLLRFFPNVQVTAAPRWGAELVRQFENQYDLVIFDRVPVPALTQGNFILINTVAPNLPMQVQGKSRNPRVVAPVTKHPITDGLSLADLQVRESLRVAVTGDGVGLGPLAGESDACCPGARQVALAVHRFRSYGFGPAAAESLFRFCFTIPSNGSNLSALNFPPITSQAGTPLPLRLPVGDGDLQITTPSGKREQLKVATSPLVFTDTLEAGLYGYKSAGREGRFAVNLFDESESQIASRLNMSVANAGARESGSPRSDGKRIFLWPLLLGARTHLARPGIFPGFSCRSFALSYRRSGGGVGSAGAGNGEPENFQNHRRFGCDIGSRPFAQRGTRRSRKGARDSRSGQPHTKPGDTTGLLMFRPLAGMGISPAPKLPGDGFRLPLGPRRDRYPGGLASRACANGRGSSGQNSVALRRQ